MYHLVNIVFLVKIKCYAQCIMPQTLMKFDVFLYKPTIETNQEEVHDLFVSFIELN